MSLFLKAVKACCDVDKAEGLEDDGDEFLTIAMGFKPIAMVCVTV